MEHKKKIAFVSNSLWSIFHFRIHIIRHLVSEGYAIYIVAPPHQQEGPSLTNEGITVITVKHLHPRKIRPWQELQLYFELKKIYATIQPDLIFHYTIKPNIFGSFAAAATGKKSIAVITGLGYTLVNNTYQSYRATIV